MDVNSKGSSEPSIVGAQGWVPKRKQELRQEAAILAKQTNPAKQDVSQTRTGCAVGKPEPHRPVPLCPDRCYFAYALRAAQDANDCSGRSPDAGTPLTRIPKTCTAFSSLRVKVRLDELIRSFGSDEVVRG